jgi:hypothetical protein
MNESCLSWSTIHFKSRIDALTNLPYQAPFKMAETNNFDMADMTTALGGSGKDTIYQGRPPTLEEASKRAREHGYVDRVNYNYTQKESTRVVSKFTRCDWIATGELGVFAPRIPQLEAELYNDEFTYGKGMHIDILEEVKIEVIGEEPVKPVDTVSSPYFTCSSTQ